MITINKMKWSNCFSYGIDNEIDFQKSIVTQLVGANGMGKSSIPLILEEGLFNKNSKGVKKSDILNRYTDKGYWIYIEFSINGESYYVDVNRKKNIKVKLFKGTEDLSSHTATATYKTIESLLGMDFKTFSQLIYQSPESSLQFLTATDTNRKKFLIDLFNLGIYLEYFEIFKKEARKSNDIIKILEGEMKSIKAWLTSNKLSDTTILPNIIIPNFPDNDEDNLRVFTEQLFKISENNKKISENNKYQELLGSINITKLQNNKLKLIPTKKLIVEIEFCKAELRLAIKDIMINKNAPNICKTCGQFIDNSKALEILETAKDNKFSCEQTLKVLVPDLEKVKDNNNKVVLNQSKIKEWENLYNKIDLNLETVLKQPQDIQKAINLLKDNIKQIKLEIAIAIKDNAKIDKHNTRIVVIQDQLNDFNSKLIELKIQYSNMNSTNSILETLKKSFSTNGLVAYKIENLIKELEDLTNKYLADLSDGRFTIQFVILKDKLNVEITDNAKSVEVTALSSGELARVNTATLIAIRRLMSSISKSKINVLFLDEVVSVLDEQGKEKLVEVLLKETDLNTFIVSHGWTHPLLEKIEVLKENNISRLE